MHTLPELPYAYDALEPHIDTETMEFHHDQHHRTYVEKLNKALKEYPGEQKKTLEELLSNLDAVPEKIRKKVRQNGGGHFNHSMLWTILNPEGARRPFGDFHTELNKTFGSFEAFKKKFTKKATELFGSGYVWLCMDENRELVIKALPNQDCPLMVGLTPLFLMDLWEHAYYLQHQNRRPEYIESFWKVTDWAEVGRRWATQSQSWKKAS